MKQGHDHYISLTDMLRAKDGDFFISDWLRNPSTVEFLCIWESVNNPDFNYGEFATIKSQAGLHSIEIVNNLLLLAFVNSPALFKLVIVVGGSGNDHRTCFSGKIFIQFFLVLHTSVAVGGYDHGFEPVRSYLFLEMHSYVFHGFGAGCSLSTSVFLRNSSLSVTRMLDCLYLAVLINLVVKVLFLPVAFKK